MKILIMGLPGSGKSTIAIQLSKLINAYYIDSDRHHSLNNIHKMNAIPVCMVLIGLPKIKRERKTPPKDKTIADKMTND